MSDWNRQANEIFLNAVECSTAEARRTYLEAACAGNPSLWSEVDALLQANQAGERFLEQPVGQLPTELRTHLPPLTNVGPYRLLEQIGEGGMGIVYMAAQETPVRRKVAVKIIKPGMDSRQIVARFEAERQALALMDHPSIARVLDAGTTDSGRPYFVMELVKGQPVTAYCEQQRLSRRKRLQLFVEVCQAVAHAHQNGIIHRDLKPSNILVTEQDGRAAVKIIDFGVAKAISQPLTDKTLYTGFSQLVGTPVYMSPEQAAFSAGGIDTRSDVYSLGVLLYELLTGTPPFTEEELRQLGPDAFRNMIREVDPPRPSDRVSTLAAEKLSTLVADDALTPHKLSGTLRGELDWIVMQALEKDRNRRYESANALGADVERYLHDQPVQACPPTTLYLLQKFTRRHRIALSTGIAVIVALLGGASLAVWQAVEANSARKLADDRFRDSQESLRQVSIAHKRADEERDRAQASAEQARQLLYAADMRLALDAWQHNDVRKLQEALDRHIPRTDQADLRGFEWYFLRRHSEVRSRDLLKSERPLYCVRVSSDGRLLAATGAAGMIHLFATTTLEPTTTIESPQGEVNGLDFSSNGAKLASSGDDGTVIVWETRSGRELQRFQAHKAASYHVLFAESDQTLITCGRDSNLRLWNLPGATSRAVFHKHTADIESIALSNQTLLAAGSRDCTISLWDIRGQNCQWHAADYPQSKVNVVAFSPSGVLIASGHDDGILTIRRADTGVLLTQHEFPDSIHSLTFSPGQSEEHAAWIAVGDRGGSIHLLPVHNHTARTGLVSSVSSSLRGRQWQAHTGRVYSLSFSKDGAKLFSAGEDGLLKAWDVDSAEFSRKQSNPVNDFAVISADLIVTAGNSLSMHSLSSVIPVRRLPGLGGDDGRRVRYSAESREIIMSDYAGRIIAISDVQQDAPTVREIQSGGAVNLFAVSADGRQVVKEVDRQGIISLEWAMPLEPQHSSIPCEHMPHDLILSSDGRYLTFDQSQVIHVVEVATGELVRTMSGHRSTIWDVTRSQDGFYLASVSKDRTVRVWDWLTGRELWSEVAHQNESTNVAFTPDGETVATTGADGVLRLWRWKQNMLVLEYPLLEWPTKKLAFSEDGLKLITLAGQSVRIYDATPSEQTDPR